jgi:hypothetical protein
MRNVWLVVALLCACGKTAAKREEAAADCAGAMARMTELGKQAMAGRPAEAPDVQQRFEAMLKSIEVSMTELCTRDKWPSSVTTCIKTMKTLAEGKACEDALTPAQKEAGAKAMAEAKKQALAAQQASGSNAPPQAEGDCDGAVDHMAELQREVMLAAPKKDQAHLQERITKMREAMLHACKETKWSAEMTTCMKNMKSLDDGDACEKMETAEQSDFAEKALEATQKAGSAR